LWEKNKKGEIEVLSSPYIGGVIKGNVTGPVSGVEVVLTTVTAKIIKKSFASDWSMRV